MKWLWRTVAILIIGGAGVWLWLTLNPSPQKVIRGQLHRLAAQVSFTTAESDIARLGKIAGITRFFTPEVDVKLAFRGRSEQGVITHEFIQAGTASLRENAPGGLQVEFLDLNVTMSPDRRAATVELTLKATTPGDNQFNVQEMKFDLGRTNDQWLIYRVETVRTLK